MPAMKRNWRSSSIDDWTIDDLRLIEPLNKVVLIFIALLPLSLLANDTVFVSGALQHDGLLDWKPVMYHSNSYLDLGVNWVKDDGVTVTGKQSTFRELRAKTRLELTQWPMPGYEADFAGHGVGHLSIAAAFTWGEITVGDVYGQFGSGLILSLYEDRALGIDGALRGAKIEAMPYKGIHLTALGGKQRRYWECYKDKAWGWNYGQDAAIGGDAEFAIEQWSEAMREKDVCWTIGGSWVSKYEQFDTIIASSGVAGAYMYNLPRWIGATDVRTRLSVKGFELLGEFAYKFNDPGVENSFSYEDGKTCLVSVSYSRKGLSVLAQMKYSENMSFRSERSRTGLAGRLNHMPAFAQQHTYALASLYPYATQYTRKELAVQGEIRYTAPRKSAFGGKYGTTVKLSAAHIRVPGTNTNEAYTDVNIELNKKLSKQWYLNAMLMYQAYNQLTVEGHGGMVRSGIAVVDARVDVNKNVSMRGEVQYLYSPHHEGQWCFALYELTLYKHWTLSGQWLYNIGFAPDETKEHYYTAGLTFSYGAHRANIGYTKTREGFNCSGGVCRYVPKMEGICANYSFTF